MLIPRFSLRWLLGLTTFSAGVSLILSHAVRGRAWAIGLTAALWSAVILGLFYIAAFLMAWMISQLTATLRSDGGGSPFAPSDRAGDEILPQAPPSSPQPAIDMPPPMTG